MARAFGPMSRRFSCPPPDLNPIKQVFAKLKHLLRKLAARTVDAVCAEIREVLTAFTSDECANYLKNAGYQT
jgi:transposase